MGKKSKNPRIQVSKIKEVVEPVVVEPSSANPPSRKALDGRGTSEGEQEWGEKLDPQEEKVLDWILKGVVIFILGWLGLSILLVIGGYFGIWK